MSDLSDETLTEQRHHPISPEAANSLVINSLWGGPLSYNHKELNFVNNLHELGRSPQTLNEKAALQTPISAL